MKFNQEVYYAGRRRKKEREKVVFVLMRQLLNDENFIVKIIINQHNLIIKGKR